MESCLWVGGVFFISVTWLFIIVYRQIRRRFYVNVACWFCDAKTKVPFDNKNCWDCPSCEQYNGFNEDGDYNKEIPAQHDSALNFSSLTRNEEREEGAAALSSLDDAHNGLCGACNYNQINKAKLLANFEPSHPERYDEEVEAYRHQLEQLYSLCYQCHLHVRRRLNEQDACLAPYVLLHNDVRRVQQAKRLWPRLVVFSVALLRWTSILGVALLWLEVLSDPASPQGLRGLLIWSPMRYLAPLNALCIYAIVTSLLVSYVLALGPKRFELHDLMLCYFWTLVLALYFTPSSNVGDIVGYGHFCLLSATLYMMVHGACHSVFVYLNNRRLSSTLCSGAASMSPLLNSVLDVLKPLQRPRVASQDSQSSVDDRETLNASKMAASNNMGWLSDDDDDKENNSPKSTITAFSTTLKSAFDAVAPRRSSRISSTRTMTDDVSKAAHSAAVSASANYLGNMLGQVKISRRRRRSSGNNAAASKKSSFAFEFNQSTASLPVFGSVFNSSSVFDTASLHSHQGYRSTQNDGRGGVFLNNHNRTMTINAAVPCGEDNHSQSAHSSSANSSSNNSSILRPSRLGSVLKAKFTSSFEQQSIFRGVGGEGDSFGGRNLMFGANLTPPPSRCSTPVASLLDGPAISMLHHPSFAAFGSSSSFDTKSRRSTAFELANDNTAWSCSKTVTSLGRSGSVSNRRDEHSIQRSQYRPWDMRTSFSDNDDDDDSDDHSTATTIRRVTKRRHSIDSTDKVSVSSQISPWRWIFSLPGRFLEMFRVVTSSVLWNMVLCSLLIATNFEQLSAFAARVRRALIAS